MDAEDQPKSYYSVPVLMRSAAGRAPEDVLCEEHIFLVEAWGEEEALEKAHLLAAENSTTYKNPYNEDVTWEPWRIGRPVQVLDQVGANAEVYYRFISVDELGTWWEKYAVWEARGSQTDSATWPLRAFAGSPNPFWRLHFGWPNFDLRRRSYRLSEQVLRSRSFLGLSRTSYRRDPSY